MMTEKKYKNRFYMLVGLPGSGKTSIAMKMLDMAGDDGKMVWLSSDRIRRELFGDESVQGDTQKVFDLMRNRTLEALREGKDVIYDACNISSKRRRAYLQNLKKLNCEKVCIVAATPYAVCIERNSHRSRVVPDEVIERMYKTWNTPAWFEGWDRMEIVFADGMKGAFGDAHEFVMKYRDYDQMSSYHGETLGTHMENTWKTIVNRGYDRDCSLALAALLHDCGKPVTKEVHRTEDGREEAHYYQHNCTGAYDAMFFDYPGKTDEDILEISLMINLHMTPFSWKSTGEHNDRMRTLWGQQLYDSVLLIHDADQAASISRLNYAG